MLDYCMFPLLGIYTKELNHYLKKTCVSPNSLQHFHNSQDKEATLVSISKWMDIYIPHFLYPFIYWWKLRLLPTLATSCEELTHWKRLWCWEGLGARGEGDNRGWDGWMASPARWMWVSVNSRSWCWTGRPGVLRFMGSQSRTRLRDWSDIYIMEFRHKKNVILPLETWMEFKGIMPSEISQRKINTV